MQRARIDAPEHGGDCDADRDRADRGRAVAEAAEQEVRGDHRQDDLGRLRHRADDAEAEAEEHAGEHAEHDRLGHERQQPAEDPGHADEQRDERCDDVRADHGGVRVVGDRGHEQRGSRRRPGAHDRHPVDERERDRGGAPSDRRGREPRAEAGDTDAGGRARLLDDHDRRAERDHRRRECAEPRRGHERARQVAEVLARVHRGLSDAGHGGESGRCGAASARSPQRPRAAIDTGLSGGVHSDSPRRRSSSLHPSARRASRGREEVTR